MSFFHCSLPYSFLAMSCLKRSWKMSCGILGTPHSRLSPRTCGCSWEQSLQVHRRSLPQEWVCLLPLPSPWPDHQSSQFWSQQTSKLLSQFNFNLSTSRIISPKNQTHLVSTATCKFVCAKISNKLFNYFWLFTVFQVFIKQTAHITVHTLKILNRLHILLFIH